MPTEQRQPIFEIRGDKSYKIWADGHIEGFAEPAIVINRIPATIREAAQHNDGGNDAR
jgi:hypothetical protein